MFGLFKAKPHKKAEHPATAPVGGSPPPASTRQHTHIQRELVRVVLKDTLRQHGVPAGWVGCDVLVAPKRVSDEDVVVQLVILKWHEALLRYAPALERQLLLDLDRFDPTVDHSRYLVSWRFAPDCGCPNMEMPDAAFGSRRRTPWRRPSRWPFWTGVAASGPSGPRSSTCPIPPTTICLRISHRPSPPPAVR